MSLQKCEANLDAVNEETLSPLTILDKPHLRVESSSILNQRGRETYPGGWVGKRNVLSNSDR
jgi:hypothetical protein